MRISKNINEPFPGLFQVRIVRRKIEYSRCFRVSEYPSREDAQAAAEWWRDDILSRLPKHNQGPGSFLTEPLSHKKSWGRVGITRYIHEDNRRANARYLRFGVNWTDYEHYPRVKSFEAGNIATLTWESELHASLTAEAFRSEWEYCKENGLGFDPSNYDNWKDTTLYPFTRPDN